jgi:hypothetical protein
MTRVGRFVQLLKTLYTSSKVRPFQISAIATSISSLELSPRSFGILFSMPRDESLPGFCLANRVGAAFWKNDASRISMLLLISHGTLNCPCEPQKKIITFAGSNL